MARCEDCDREMATAAGCAVDVVVYPDGSELPAIPWSGPGRCRDCAATPGHPHHLNCALESCPRCKGQLISCPCDSAAPTLH